MSFRFPQHLLYRLACRLDHSGDFLADDCAHVVFGEHAIFDEIDGFEDVDFVVTEYGVADLWGKNIRERATRLIDIAHPDHRPGLLAAARQRRYVFASRVDGGA